MLYRVVLKSDGNCKVQAIKIVMDVTGCSLAEGKNFVESLPHIVIQNIDEQRATKICQDFIAIGCNAVLETMENENIPVSAETYIVKLERVGNQSIQTIKEVREATGLGLKEAKDLVDSAPSVILTNATEHQAMKLKQLLESFGDSVSVICNAPVQNTAQNITNASYTGNSIMERCQKCGSTDVVNAGFFDKILSKATKKCKACNNKW